MPVLGCGLTPAGTAQPPRGHSRLDGIWNDLAHHSSTSGQSRRGLLRQRPSALEWNGCGWIAIYEQRRTQGFSNTTRAHLPSTGSNSFPDSTINSLPASKSVTCPWAVEKVNGISCAFGLLFMTTHNRWPA